VTASVPFALIGAGGMLAGEFLRLAELHPALELLGFSTRAGGERLDALQPHLSAGRERAALDLGQLTGTLAEALERGPAVLVLALPHGETAATWRGLRGELGTRAERLTVVDLSADYRLADPGLYADVYGREHPDVDELAAFRYALPELSAEPLGGAGRLAAPGCFATALQLACVPAARSGLLDAARPMVLNGVTGSSGSGIKPSATTHHPHRDQNLFAYSIGGHRHEAELSQALGPTAPPIVFVPHSGPFVRGIHLTAALPLAPSVQDAELRAAFEAAFQGAPFVELLPAEGPLPSLRTVVGSNRAQIAVRARGATGLVLVTLDNVAKGGAGQALQALNLSLGFAEDAGLPRAGLAVV
jgi:N-acetyl-gamma-glutamyl-phosphate reductase